MSVASQKLPLRLVAEGVLLAVKVKPHSRLTRIELQIDAAGLPVLIVPVSAPAERGKANAALCVLLAKSLGLPKSAVTVQSGQTSAHKQVLLCGAGDALQQRVAQWLKDVSA